MTVQEVPPELSVSKWEELAIFELMDRLQLRDLIRMGQVCRRFNWMYQKACRYIPVRSSITLVIGDGAGSTDPFNTLYVSKLDRKVCERIVELLPNTTSLEIINNSTSRICIDEIVFLLNTWAGQLHFLELVLVKKIEPSIQHQQLFNAINQMPKLKHFLFHYYDRILVNDIDIIHVNNQENFLSLSILRQLESFNFFSMDEALLLLDQLIRYASDNQAIEVMLYNFVYSFDSINILSSDFINESLASRFYVLRLRCSFINIEEITEICQHFNSISSLEIESDLLSVSQLSHALATLSNLIMLTWTVKFPNRAKNRNFVRMEPETVDLRQLAPLPTVETLELNLVLGSHSDLTLLHLPTLFPNVTTLRFSKLSCDVCGFHNDTPDFELKQRCLHQLQHTASFWRSFPKLSKLQYNWLETNYMNERPVSSALRPFIYFLAAILGPIIIHHADILLINLAKSSDRLFAKTSTEVLTSVPLTENLDVTFAANGFYHVPMFGWQLLTWAAMKWLHAD